MSLKAINIKKNNQKYSRRNLILTLKSLKKELKQHDLDFDIIDKDKYVPVSIFNKKLTILESLIKFLKENRGKRYVEISGLLNRDERNVWLIYKNSLKKRKQRLKEKGFYIPLNIFSSNALEALVYYLHVDRKMRFVDIGKLIGRDQRTISSSYYKSIKK